MSVSKILFALAAVGAGVASAQSSSCKASTITVSTPAEATIGCKTVSGSVVFEASDDLTGAILINGPETIQGDLIIKNATAIQSLGSSTISKIGGKFELQGLRSLSTIDFSALEEVEEISWITLTSLEGVTFGTDGVTTVKKVRISDTFLGSLDNFKMASVGTFQIDNNKLLTTWETKLTNITDELIVADNSQDLQVSFPRLTNAGDIDVRGVKSLSVPLLKEVTGSILLTENDAMESFIAPNFTKSGESVSVRNNDNLSNVSFPLLERTGGSLTIQNNQKLVTIDGFPELVTVEGAVTMRGNFTEIELPKLDDVRGAFDVQSTEDIAEACSAFEKLSPDGGNGHIQGSFDCEGENENANEGGSADGSKDKEDAAGIFGASAPVVLAVAAIGGLLQLL
ncbi:related to sporulation-specific gene SPS2 [Cephalotrichum gorgonifer]|uniref:Related to sporulation-specific gene SPS2 n=1 Tax=Cephalotrichum gorgonifer TaxID=2041049 RepID=A0AAE8MS69_9PEZI|nr:related to sporulation-specific gene SPS2 [Cephalotrichum gorgonifer]